MRRSDAHTLRSTISMFGQLASTSSPSASRPGGQNTRSSERHHVNACERTVRCDLRALRSSVTSFGHSLNAPSSNPSAGGSDDLSCTESADALWSADIGSSGWKTRSHAVTTTWRTESSSGTSPKNTVSQSSRPRGAAIARVRTAVSRAFAGGAGIPNVPVTSSYQDASSSRSKRVEASAAAAASSWPAMVGTGNWCSPGAISASWRNATTP
mmetsp:Transcript_16712/g.51888  ORF Transcript_16712/g.51888 Transcript_16712/m.51888 type:complete len:212 (-) Transcript_16712:403-1038(-)